MMPILFAATLASGESRSETSRADRAREEQASYEQEASAAPWKSAVKVLAPVVIIFALTWALADLAPLVR